MCRKRHQLLYKPGAQDLGELTRSLGPAMLKKVRRVPFFEGDGALQSNVPWTGQPHTGE
jgi:hypothetical protein